MKVVINIIKIPSMKLNATRILYILDSYEKPLNIHIIPPKIKF